MSTTGYTVHSRGQVVGTFWCQDCAAKTCDCFYLARAQAHEIGHAEVYGETGGREALLAFIGIAGGIEAEQAREDARWDAKEKAGAWRPRRVRRKHVNAA